MPPARKKPSRFPDTRWSLIGRAAASDEITRQQALADLLVAYTPGLRAFLIESRRMPADLADDLLQSFIADKVLRSGLVRHADSGRGKFRSFVVKSLNNFVSTKLRREYAAGAKAAGLAQLDARQAATQPETNSFDQKWVQEVVRDALRLMEADCRNGGRQDLWEIFRLRVVEPMLSDADPAAYDDIVRQFGIATPRQAINLLASAKRSFLSHLHCAVGKYVDESRIDEEIADLREIVGR